MGSAYDRAVRRFGNRPTRTGARDAPAGGRCCRAPGARDRVGPGPVPGAQCSDPHSGHVGSPEGVAVVLAVDEAPVDALRNRGGDVQFPTELVEEPVGLTVVAGPAGGHHVLPDVLASAAAG